MSHLTISAFKSAFDHCVVSLKKCGSFYDNVHITGGSGCYGMSRKLVLLCHNWNKIIFIFSHKTKARIIMVLQHRITLKM